ncbi:RAD3-like DEAD/DEAH box helicase [Promicromonospora sp. AC04]|uniref:DEAD/DEAH box helicase n=1 Tax=Promicromonospora sp. AC04 TaxID=2135723 RepID=UPI000D359AB9|nr:DEAD/DEAH box helicase [Promicromonospora sp. AC04]PUB20183.1 RAD3-like DEAD/DEAH box helicase [Promicromonospora sp. AC04]
MPFVGKSKKVHQQFDTPEELYLRGALPRTADAVSSMWIHQGDVLRAYAEGHHDTPDLALELPTGTGKTLPGLLIAEWIRRKAQGPVLFAAPTRQLAHQVLSTAATEGVPARLLVGSHHGWSAADESDVDGGEAIAITTYSSIFNSSPKLPVPRLIVLDDAHAGEQFVGEKYGVTIRRYEAEAAYLAVLDALRPFLSGLQFQRLQGQPDPGAHHQVRLILPAIEPAALATLDAALSQLGEPYKFQLAMVRTGLAACCVYLSYGGIQIRPMVPPTFENRVFSHAVQRIYLSATLGAGGELERAFGRSDILRMPLPTKTPPRSGRRLFVFPDLVKGGDAVGLTKDIIGITNKALVLSQASSQETEEAARLLAGANIPVLGKSAVQNGLRTFAKAKTGLLGLANRYDGMDLPGDACRIVVLGGKPDAVSLQEKFLSERAQASAALSERLRTRIVQGAGRCTRGPNDYAVVVVLGSDITRYFSRSENTSALEPELQAEVHFGWENSRGQDASDILDNVRTFLDHETDWRENGEPLVVEFREEVEKTDPPGAVALGQMAKLEVAAWRLAFAEDWIAASQQLEDAARVVGKGGEATRGYRGLLLHIAGTWLHLGAKGEAHRARARQLLRDAEKASTRGTWLKEMTELPGAEEVTPTGADAVAINTLVATLGGQFRPNKIKADLEQMREGLSQDAAGPYEAALTTLGTYLGAVAAKPPGQGRCDSAWRWDTAMWLTIEAKSEEHSDGLLPLKDIRQANTQLDQLATDQGTEHAPAGSPTILVSDRLTVAPEHAPVANPNVYLASTEVVSQIAGDVEAVWADLLAAAAKQGSLPVLRRHVQNVLTENGCLPLQVLDRLMQDRLRPGG